MNFATLTLIVAKSEIIRLTYANKNPAVRLQPAATGFCFICIKQSCLRRKFRERRKIVTYLFFTTFFLRIWLAFVMTKVFIFVESLERKRK